MNIPLNARDKLLQQTSPRVLNIASSFITLVSPNLEAKYGSDNTPTPSLLEITAVLSGSLKGTVYYEVSGLLPNTSLITDPAKNKLFLNPGTFATDSVTVTAKLDFEGVQYTSVPVTAYKTFSAVVTRLSRPFDNIAADSNGNSYTLPGTNYLELYNGINKFTTGVVYGPATQNKHGLICTVNSATGEISLSQAAANSWTTDHETFTLTATRNFVTYTVSYSVNKVREGGTGVDLTPPPTPTNFSATAAINTIVVSHDLPTYTYGHGHSHTVLYGKIYNPGDVLTPFNPADKLAEFTGSGFVLASEPGVTWRLWAKWVSKDGGITNVPAGGTNGIIITTGQDVTKLLEVLQGELTESQLYNALKTRLNKIESTETSVNTLSTTVAGPNGTTAQYTVKTTAAGHVAGFGLSNTVNTAGAATSEFIIVADKFAIAPVSTDNTLDDGSPFFHRTTATTINGVNVPAGTYMKAAFIHDATINNAKIANLAVDNAKLANLAVTNAKINDLNASKINAGYLSADRIEAGSIAANKLSVNSLSAISATIGTLRTATTGARMEISDNIIRVYDANNTVRVKIGNLD